ncbi:Aldehyde dehydrogenase [Carabus blaptoides fortunei]
MDYEHVTENCDLALAWLAQHNNEFCKLAGDHNDAQNVSEITNENVTVKVQHITQLQLEEIIQKSEAQLKTWLSLSGMEKAKLLNRLAAEIERHATLLSQLEMFSYNIPTKTKSYRAFVDYLRYYAGWASLIEKEFVDYKPYGLCGVSVDTTCCLGALGMILAPALAAGNSVIVSVNFRFAPIVIFIEELCKNVGFPDGVINVVVSDTLPSLVSTKTTLLQHVWSQKNVELQINSNHSFTMLHVGHSSMIVFDNADVDSVCDKICETAWPHRGMFPWGVTKLLVHEPIFKEFLTMLESKLHKLKVGRDGRAKSLDIVLPKEENVSTNVELVNGLPVIIGNKEFGQTVITTDAGDITLSIIEFRTANEAAALANNSRFGFAASIWTESISLANEMTAKLKMGIVWINTHGYIGTNASFTPYKDSGLGYFGGREGLMEYLTYNKTNDFQPVQLKKTEVKTHLPGPVQNKRVLLYYGGASKKSESGLTECDNEFPNRKDIRNCVEVARKGYESWNRLSHKVRGQVLWKLAESSASIKTTALSAKWMEYLYEWAVLSNEENCKKLKSHTNDATKHESKDDNDCDDSDDESLSELQNTIDANFTMAIFDPNETADNIDPGWNGLRELRSSEDYFQSVRDQWRSLSLPNPHRDITRRYVVDKRATNNQQEQHGFEDKDRAISCDKMIDYRIDMSHQRIVAMRKQRNNIRGSPGSKMARRKINRDIEETQLLIRNLEKNREEVKQINSFYNGGQGSWNAYFLTQTQASDVEQQDKVFEFQMNFYQSQ